MTRPDLDALDAARESAWRELDAAERAMPDCQHNRAWRLRIDVARDEYRKALKAAEKAAGASAGVPLTSLPAAPEPQLDGQEALFELGTEAA